jgi:integrase/recombinase XerD
MDKYRVYPVLWDYKKNKKKIYTIKIAICLNRQNTWLITPHRIHVDQWDKKAGKVVGHINARTMNADIRKRVTDKEAELMALNIQEIPITKAAIRGDKKAGRSFKSFAKEIRDHRVEIPRIVNFGGEGLMLRDIDPAWLRRFEAHERSRVDDEGNRCVNDNTISITMKYLAQIIGQAYKEKLIPENSFDAYNRPAYIDPERIWLVEEEKAAILKLIVEGLRDPMRTTAIYFLLGCETGIRHSDWAAFNPDTMISTLPGGVSILRLRARKNSGDVVMPIGPTLSRIIDLVRTAGRPFSLEQCNLQLKSIGPMAGLEKTLSTHKARHSFGYLCASLGLPKSTTAELMAIGVKTVEVYYHLSGQNIMKQAALLASR